MPCIECNRSIKFRDLLATARELGAQALATGHYVASRRLGDGSRALYAPRDADRDQSYFLFATTREQLDFLRFPLGDMTKPQTRELARRFGLAVADKQDSQDICFVPTGRYTDIIERLKPDAIEPGDIVDLDGRVLGRHDGIVHFTVGQRRGLGIAAGAPLYVVRLDAASRRVVVGPREALRMHRIPLRDVNWIGDGALDRVIGDGLEMFVKVRSTRAPQPAWLRAADGGYEVELVAGEEGVSPGQACVFYDAPSGQARVLGGGFIKSATARECGEGRRAQTTRRGRSPRRCADRKFGAGGMAADIDREGVEKAYARWAPVYDLVFGKVFEHGRQSTIAEADKIGGRDPRCRRRHRHFAVGLFAQHEIVGVDISEPMLRKAQSACARSASPMSKRWR